MYVSIHMYVCIYIYVSIHICMYMYTYIYVHIYIHIYIYTHTHTHTLTHTHTQDWRVYEWLCARSHYGAVMQCLPTRYHPSLCSHIQSACKATRDMSMTSSLPLRVLLSWLLMRMVCMCPPTYKCTHNYMCTNTHIYI